MRQITKQTKTAFSAVFGRMQYLEIQNEVSKGRKFDVTLHYKRSMLGLKFRRANTKWKRLSS